MAYILASNKGGNVFIYNNFSLPEKQKRQLLKYTGDVGEKNAGLLFNPMYLMRTKKIVITK